MEWQVGFMSFKMLSNNCHRIACLHFRKISPRLKNLRSTNNHVTFSRQGYLGSVRMRTIIIFVEIEKSRVCILRNLLRNSCIWERSLWSMVWFWPLGGVRETCCISHGWFHFFVCNFFNCFMPESSWWVNDNVICIA